MISDGKIVSTQCVSPYQDLFTSISQSKRVLVRFCSWAAPLLPYTPPQDMLVLLPPPMSTSLSATGAKRPFLPDLLLPVEFWLSIRLFCFLKFATVSFHSFMKKTVWEKHVSFRPELELEVLARPLPLALFLPFLGFFFFPSLALDRLGSPAFCFLFNLCLLALSFLFLRPLAAVFLCLPPPLLAPSAPRISRPAVSERLFSSPSSAA